MATVPKNDTGTYSYAVDGNGEGYAIKAISDSMGIDSVYSKPVFAKTMPVNISKPDITSYLDSLDGYILYDPITKH